MTNPVLDHNPMQHFQKWFHKVDTVHPEIETNVMLLSTIGLDGYPKSRIVLLKRFTWDGFIILPIIKVKKELLFQKTIEFQFFLIGQIRNVLFLLLVKQRK